MTTYSNGMEKLKPKQADDIDKPAQRRNVKFIIR